MFNRWLVREEYYGKFDSIDIICTTRSIDDAALVIEGLLMYHAGRPFRYFAEKCSIGYVDYLYDVITPEHDFSKYVNGVDCLDYVKGCDSSGE